MSLIAPYLLRRVPESVFVTNEIVDLRIVRGISKSYEDKSNIGKLTPLRDRRAFYAGDRQIPEPNRYSIACLLLAKSYRSESTI
jgi:hypothetical protein